MHRVLRSSSEAVQVAGRTVRKRRVGDRNEKNEGTVQNAEYVVAHSVDETLNAGSSETDETQKRRKQDPEVTSPCHSSASQTPKSKDPILIFICGTSSVGKTTLIRSFLIHALPAFTYVSADSVFDSLKQKEKYKYTPYKELKKLVPQELATKVNRLLEKNTSVLLDDISFNILSILPDTTAMVVTLVLFAPLADLAIRATSREGGGNRRPLSGVLQNYTELFSCTRTDKSSKQVGTVSLSEIEDFLKRDQTISSIALPKIREKAARALRMQASREDLPLFLRTSRDCIVVETTGLSKKGIYERVLKALPETVSCQCLDIVDGK